MEYTSLQKSYIWFDSIEGLKSSDLSELITHFGTAYDIIKNFLKEKKYIASVIGEELYNIMSQKLNKEYTNTLINFLLKKDINIITCEDENYPTALLEFDDKPFLLYTLGDISLLSSTIVTVVGSRRCTRYGLEQTEKIVKELCYNNITVASGLAEGIDTTANRTALTEGKTIAVTAGGFENIYPRFNGELFNKITENGLVISAQRPQVSALPYMFPLRNRIMAAISDATVIIEAGEKSGALITANLALELGKGLFVLPGNVNSPSSKGSNSLLKQMQGAIITDCNDILMGLGINIKEKQNDKENINDHKLTEEESVIYNILNLQEEHIDDITQKCGFTVNKVNSILTMLEIKGLIKKLPQNRFGI